MASRVAVLMSYLSSDRASRDGIERAVASLAAQPGLDITLCIRCVGEPVGLPEPRDGYVQLVTQVSPPETWSASQNANMAEAARWLARDGERPDYFAILNADDEYMPGGLTALVRSLDADPSAVLAYGDYYADGSAGNVTRPEQLDLARSYGLGPFICWRASAGLTFDPWFYIAADWDMARRAYRMGEFVCPSVPVGRFLVRPDSLSHADPGRLRHEQAMIRKGA